MKYQLVPPNNHCRNAVKKVIHIFKKHCVYVLCGADENFLMHLWCTLLPYTETQLNMRCKSAINTPISVFEHLNGPHNYDLHPFAITGRAVEIHVMLINRRTWQANTKTRLFLSGTIVGTLPLSRRMGGGDTINTHGTNIILQK